MVAPLIALALAASSGSAAVPQPRPKPRQLPARITLPAKPVVKIKTVPHARSTK